MKNFFWLGIRESDIYYAKELFKGAILLFGKRKDDYYIFDEYRANQNYFDDKIKAFYINAATDVISKYPDAEFVLYNQKMLSFLPEAVKKRTVLYSNPQIRRTLSHKISSRRLVEDIIPSPPYVEMIGCDIDHAGLSGIFPESEAFLIQDCLSGGGVGTYLLNKDTYKQVLSALDKKTTYLVSGYLPDTLPINVHVLIRDGKIKIYPCSVQLLCRHDCAFRYIGADFAAFNSLTEKEQSNIYDKTERIATRVLKMGYNGIFGIDFLLRGNDLYFCEINARFQGSTMWLDCLLKKNGLNSVYHDYLYGFTDTTVNLKDHGVSGLLYYGNDPHSEYFYDICNDNKSLCEVHDDGYTGLTKCDENSYLFRATFFRNISWKPSYESVRIFENLVHDNFEKCENERLKIALLARGIRIPNISSEHFSALKEGVFSSLDIKLSNDTCVNVPFGIDFSEFSPYSLNATDDGNYYLSVYGKRIDDITIEHCAPTIYDYCTPSGRKFSDIFYLATDRIRIRVQGGCDLKAKDVGCKFCNVPKGSCKYDVNEIIDGLSVIESSLDFKHYMIGGGSDLTESSWGKIMKIASAIKQTSGKQTTLMCIAPENIEIMRRLKQSGIDDVSFNLELCDDKLAKDLMPYKGMPRKEYIRRLKDAVTVWGKFNVRSMLLVGLEPDEKIYSMVDELCKHGIQPVLSVFRPLSGSCLADAVPLDSERLYKIYLRATAICTGYGTQLGPKCKDCKNNTLSY